MSANSTVILGELLRDVSRSFYLTLRVLPLPIRQPMGIAYLLARAADTVADTEIIVAEQRLTLLNRFRQALAGDDSVALFLAEMEGFIKQQRHAGERRLLARLDEVFSHLFLLPRDDQEQVIAVVMTLTDGMLLDLQHFPLSEPGRVVALPNAQSLDRYLYLVAGCVGEFWSAICFAHDKRLRHWDLPAQQALGVQFGKALQLTNILRDIAADLHMGRCYLPEDQLADLNLSVEVLLDCAHSAAMRPLHHQWIAQALSHYTAAGQYITHTPRRCILLRLATLWPVLIGLKTLRLTALNHNYLNPGVRVKVGRFEIYRLMLVSFFVVGSNVATKWWLKRLRGRVMAALVHQPSSIA
ncbi:MAG: squalene/phytoene synthase family protein [Gammaproteobacteria bacterium]|nr:squalene/phytoene synthase family protein [Gammaproteobacteria bacterium]MCF6230292.1 squalene/phytoene synthase family protein [Gammaproteobacteria bacterium]